MICPQCGATMEKGALHCPYCGYENEHAARRQHEGEIRSIYARLSALLHLPQAFVRRGTKYLLTGISILAVLFVSGILLAVIWSNAGPQIEYRRQQSQLAELESLYAAGDYTALEEALDAMEEAYGASYDKYRIVSDMAQQLKWVQEDCAETLEFLRDYPEGVDLLAYPLSLLFSVLNTCDDMEAAGYIYEEEAAIAYLRSEAHRLLKNLLLLEDDEIREGMTLARQDNADYSDLYTAIAARITGDIQ